LPTNATDKVAAVRFEKWQALGNDYAIVEERELPFALTADRIRALCAPHTGIGSDGILLLSETEERGFVAAVRIYNPDGSEAELSGNGVRQAVMYLRRNGWADHDSFSVRTAAGEIRPRITGPTTCTIDMGRASLRSDRDFPSGGEDGVGSLSAGGRGFRFQFVQVGNPQCAIEVPEGLEELELGRYGPEIERHELFPNRTNVSFWRRIGEGRIRARIFERGVGETMSSGTGATGAAIAAVVRGVDSPVTVRLDGGELEVDVGEDLHVDLTGPALPVYRATLSDELIEELHEAK
jgi:diaminopimelate epimerase